MRTCKKCNQEKPIEMFEVTNKERGWRRHECKDCVKSRVQRHYISSKKDIERAAKWNKDNRERHNELCLNSYYKSQHEAIMAYGGYVCACCGETEPLFLSIDHINNDGAEHRKALKFRGGALYNWLKKNGYPEGFQVLCMNCNHGKRRNHNVCPHHGHIHAVNKLIKGKSNDHSLVEVGASAPKRVAPRTGEDMVLTIQ